MRSINTVNQLLREVETITNSYKLVTKTTGDKFNIFSILKIERNEVNTHSRLIAELLNKNGSHGQGNKYLKLFLDNLAIKSFNINEGYSVHVEFFAGKVTKDKGGRIDILIKNKQSEVILIENKIYASEQPKQLYRYQNTFPNAKEILYLTLHGEKSQDESSENVNYQCISYSRDIINWLEDCRKEAVNIPILRETITQYVNLLKKLTGQNLNQQMNKEITSRILRDRESMEAYTELIKSRNHLYRTVMEETIIPLFTRIENDYGLKATYDKNAFIIGVGKYNTLRFSNQKMIDVNLSISFCFNTPSKEPKDFIFGFAYYNHEGIKERDTHNDIRDTFDKSFGQGMATTQDYLRWLNYENYENWNDLSVLKSIYFKDFEQDIEVKINKMLEIIDEYSK